jgi:O-6-methylguanine DNA methyltransferase
MTEFERKVRAFVRSIPLGKVFSYRDVAKHAGSPGAFRAVGTMLKKNQDLDIPCHRVICSDGRVGEYNGLRGEKADRLRSEGIEIYRGRVVRKFL